MYRRQSAPIQVVQGDLLLSGAGLGQPQFIHGDVLAQVDDVTDHHGAAESIVGLHVDLPPALTRLQGPGFLGCIRFPACIREAGVVADHHLHGWPHPGKTAARFAVVDVQTHQGRGSGNRLILDDDGGIDGVVAEVLCNVTPVVSLMQIVTQADLTRIWVK